MWKRKGAYRVVVEKPEGRRPLGRPRSRWDNNIKIYFTEVGWENTDWIDVVHDRDRWRAFVYAVMNL
jgi:hypothetical protein